MCRCVWFLFVFVLLIGGTKPFITRRRSCVGTNGGWSAWSAWGRCVCDYTTGTGTQTATRVCNNPTPKCGGRDCEGSTIQSIWCDASPKCCRKTNGGYTSWSWWTDCTCDPSTGKGTSGRTRKCSSPAPSCGGLDCYGPEIESKECTVDPSDVCWRCHFPYIYIRNVLCVHIVLLAVGSVLLITTLAICWASRKTRNGRIANEGGGGLVVMSQRAHSCPMTRTEC